MVVSMVASKTMTGPTGCSRSVSLTLLGEALPASLQPLSDQAQLRIEPAQVALREGFHHESALRAPGIALGGAQAIGPYLGKDARYRAVAREGFWPRAQDLLTGFSIRNSEHAQRPHPKHVLRAILVGPTLENEMQTAQLELVRVTEQRETARPRQILESALGSEALSGAPQRGDVDVQGAFALDDGTAREALGPAIPRARFAAEAPAMVATDELCAFEFTFTEQRALVRAAPFERAEPRRRMQQDEIRALCRHGVRTVALELVEEGDTRKSGCRPAALLRGRNVRHRHRIWNP